MQKSIPGEVLTAFEQVEPNARAVLLDIRALILETTNNSAEIGAIDETLKWGQPSYLPKKARIGSTLRLWVDKDDGHPTLFVNCQTDLLDQIREIYPSQFHYGGARAVSLRGALADARAPVSHIILMVLGYHLRKART